MIQTLVLHGSFGSKDGNRFPWLASELEKRGEEVYVPQMPVGVGKQNFESWAKELDKINIGKDTCIVAHSIAPIFVCKYLIARKLSVSKLLFVCGFNNYTGIDPDFDAVNAPMFTDNFAEVKNYCSEISCFYSDNDPYVPFEKEKEFADTLTDHQFIIKDGGHINTESGYTIFPQILTEIANSK